MPATLERTTAGEGTRQTPADVSYALCVAGAVAGLVHLIGILGFGRGFEMVAVARNLAEHGVFADPFDAGPTGPTAANPPIYPMLLAFWFRILRSPALVTYAAVMGNIAANALSAVLLPRVSLVLFADRFPGMVAAFACLAAMQLMPAWDTSYTIAGTLLFCLISAATMTRNAGATNRGALAGLGAGALVLLNPSSLMITLPWVAWLALRRKALAWCAAMIACLCLVVSVWLGRNELRLGAPVLRTNFGMSVYASNNDCAAASLIEDEKQGCYEAHHPNTSREEARLVRALGEVAYDRKRTADTLDWLMAHPRQFGRLTMARVRQFWFPSPVRSPWTAVVWLMTGLSVPGLVAMSRRHEPATLFLLIVAMVYPLMYYVVVSDMRYRYPILWISALAAGYFVRVFESRLRARFPALLR